MRLTWTLENNLTRATLAFCQAESEQKILAPVADRFDSLDFENRHCERERMCCDSAATGVLEAICEKILGSKGGYLKSLEALRQSLDLDPLDPNTQEAILDIESVLFEFPNT